MSLSRRQQQALDALLHHPSFVQAARAAGCDESTLRRYMRHPEFRAAYTEAQRLARHEALHLLTQGLVGAVVTARTLCTDQNQPAPVRLRAAALILEQAFKRGDVADLEERVADLEAQDDQHGEP